MKALSFHQPRAEQIVRGEKTVDVRTWRVSYRGPLAIHASTKRRDGRCRALGFDPGALAYGALVGTVELVEIAPLDAAAYEALHDRHLLASPFPGTPCYAWYLENPLRLAEPIPYRGRMRLFEVDLDPDHASLITHRASRTAHHAPYRVTPPPEPDPERPFALYAIPEGENGYRVALYQWVPTARNGLAGTPPQSRAPGALWSVEVGGDPLRAVTDHLLTALRANDYKATALARATGGETPFYLDEPSGLRLALILMAVKPLSRHDRIEAIGQGVQLMSDEEAYYWFSKCSGGSGAVRAQRALRILLAEE